MIFGLPVDAEGAGAAAGGGEGVADGGFEGGEGDFAGAGGVGDDGAGGGDGGCGGKKAFVGCEGSVDLGGPVNEGGRVDNDEVPGVARLAGFFEEGEYIGDVAAVGGGGRLLSRQFRSARAIAGAALSTVSTWRAPPRPAKMEKPPV